MKSPRTALLLALLALGSVLAAQTNPKGKAQPRGAAGSGAPCARPEPRPIVADGQPGVKAHSFKKSLNTKSNGMEASETVELESGEVIKVTHWGCKYYMLNFDFESKDRLAMATGVAAGYQEAAKALRQLITLKAKVGFNLEKAAKALETRAKDPKVAYIHPVPLAKGSRDQITVKGAGPNQAKSAGHVEFEFMRGPL